MPSQEIISIELNKFKSMSSEEQGSNIDMLESHFKEFILRTNKSLDASLQVWAFQILLPDSQKQFHEISQVVAEISKLALQALECRCKLYASLRSCPLTDQISEKIDQAGNKYKVDGPVIAINTKNVLELRRVVLSNQVSSPPVEEAAAGVPLLYG